MLISLSSFVKETMAGFYRACIVCLFLYCEGKHCNRVYVTKPCHMLDEQSFNERLIMNKFFA